MPCNNNSQPRPFMFGGHNTARTYSNTNDENQRSSGRCDTVRDCMTWINTLPAELRGNSNYYWGGMGGGSPAPAADYNTYALPTQQQQATVSHSGSSAPVAYMSIPGQGGKGDLQPISIPVQVGPSGSKMGPLPVMEPLVINATAPTSGNGEAQPFTFQIGAEHYATPQQQRRGGH